MSQPAIHTVINHRKSEQGSLVALYLRVSTAEQAEAGFSLSAQEECLREDCRQQEKAVFKVYTDVGSGASWEPLLLLLAVQ